MSSMAASKFRRVLQDPLRLEDTLWQFAVDDLPKAVDCNGSGYMKSCHLTANLSEQSLVLTFLRISPNRAISHHPLSDFIHITCSDFRLQTADKKPTTIRESNEYLSRFLKSGLTLNGIHYAFYGHSNSQLKPKSCFLMAGTQAQVDDVVNGLGDFSKMKTVAKKAKRIGLLFSTAHVVVNVDPSRCEDVGDIEREDYIFTDGCGNISPQLARLLTQKRPIIFRNKRYHPSVFQIRYRGYKGIVIVEPMLKGKTLLQLRKSMRKFSGHKDYGFAVVEFSEAKPELAHLVDCIVFSTKGRRPAADMMSGGDLDGDKFFVCWDADLIPPKVAQAAEYPAQSETITFRPISTEDRIDYFAKSSSVQLGQIKNLYLRWARITGPLSSQCQELNRLFSQCVDATKIKIPPRLEELPEQPSLSTPFILDELHGLARQQIQTYKKPQSLEVVMPEELLLDLFLEPQGLSQFELAQLTLRWCQKSKIPFETFWQFFDHTSLSIEEKAWLLTSLPKTRAIAEVILNDLMSSEILLPIELRTFGLCDHRIRWRRVFNSGQDRLANLLETVNRTFPVFMRKLLVLGIDERLSVVIYLPRIIQPSDEYLLSGCGKLFAFPHSHGLNSIPRVVVPTKHNALLFYNTSVFQLYEGKRANTFVYLGRAGNDDSSYRSVKGMGDRKRARENTVVQGINYELVTSVALNKFSQGLLTHIGRVRREGVSAAELYVISNTDTRSTQALDLALEEVDTQEIHQNFDNQASWDIALPKISDVEWETESSMVTQFFKEQHLNVESGTLEPCDVERILQISYDNSVPEYSHQICTALFRCLGDGNPHETILEAVQRVVNFLDHKPNLVIYFLQLCPWSRLSENVAELLQQHASNMLSSLILCVDKLGGLALQHFGKVFSEMPQVHHETAKDLLIQVALTVSSVEDAMDILIGDLSPRADRLILDGPEESQYFVNQLLAIVIEHIEESNENTSGIKAVNYQWEFSYDLQVTTHSLLLKADHRIDAPKTARLATGDHVRFISTNPASSAGVNDEVMFEALVEKTEVGQVTFQCLRRPPPFYRQCSWRMRHCGSFVTSRTMIDAVTKLMSQRESCCGIFSFLFQSTTDDQQVTTCTKVCADLTCLNSSQQAAVHAATTGPVTCVWGPPGTGKTHTILVIIHQFLLDKPKERTLITAPTHNAVDHLMRQFLKYSSKCKELAGLDVVRVSTDVRKVASDLRTHTCDAMLGKDINEHPAARRKAQKRITASRLIFTNCVGAGLGLLRTEHFENVIIDEASQQTEAASLIPLVKGCCRAVLVGDHVQLRATVHPHAQILGHDISLFERLWTKSAPNTKIRRVMLDTQYRMHPGLCDFPSKEFYQSKLKTAEQCYRIAVPVSKFSWPSSGCRAVFVQVSLPEDLGRKSKSNTGQIQVCKRVIQQLTTLPRSKSQNEGHNDTTQPHGDRSYSIAILTPYTRQAVLLRQNIPEEDLRISSIDGFQGQEADVIVYVTVRCNLRGEIGFLEDMRRLNVAVTRAKAGLIVIGDKSTLCGKGRTESDEPKECFETWTRLLNGLKKVEIETI